uniref:IgGFc-binding protein-like n=1 Tax=Oncorhynchus gorbuscha TaxID=8017 RepID=UPI001EAF4067|nr:IgGFc-binding protein-like [Oncorhynchus gorbuscha]
MKGSLQCFVVLLLTGLCSAGPAGKEFATAFMQNYIEDYKGSSFKIEVASPPTSLQPTEVKVTALGKVYEKTVDPGKSMSFDLPKGVEMIGSKKNLPTVLIEASQEVTVLSLNYKKETADTSVVYPVKDWGTEYFIFTPMSTAGDRFSKEFSIINYKEKNFGVEVYLTGPVTFQRQKYFAGSKLTIDLLPFESVQIQSQFDLSGTNVISKFPVGVLSGHSCTKKYTGCNHVYEQLQPVKSWGKEFIVAPLPFHKDINRYDSLYIQTSQFTQVKVIQTGIDFLTLPMFPGQSLELIVTWPNSYYLSADKGIQVLYEFNGGDIGKKQYYDPFLFTILPTDQFSTSYSLEGQAGFHNMFVMVALTKDLGGFTVDKLPMPLKIEWHKVDGTEYSWAEVLYGTGASFHQIAHANSPFAIYSIGGAYANGYGSPASGNPDAPECPKNSHYEVCGRGCPATCDDPEGLSMCKTSCVKGCTCDKGYVLNGKKCVPKSQCGCLYNDRFVKAGASLWVDEHCIERCTCNSSSLKMECKSTGCPLGQECQMVDGKRDCHPMAYSTCMVSGDPHYRTFDGHHYSFQGTCVYQMAGVCTNNKALEHFDVLVQNDGRGKKAGSSTKLVEVVVYGHTIIISKEHKGLVLVDEELTNLPVKLLKGKVQVYLSGGFAVIHTDFGVKVSYDWHSTSFVTIPHTYSGAMCGMCGNYNFKLNDDMQMKNGKQAATPEELGQSWRVAEIPGCVHGCKDKNHCPNCDITQKENFETNEFCGKIRDPKGPFRNCHAKVDPSSFFDDCVYDVCLNNGNKNTLCSSLQTYTAACQQNGAEVFAWRSKDFCEFKHPANSHYKICANGCPATCNSMSAPTSCKTLCQEGWACDAGFILSGDQCVPLSQCGCLYNDRYYKNGQVFHPNGLCQEECTCNGKVNCVKFSCGPHETCEVKNGVRDCQAVGKGVCTISGDPHYKTFDNSLYDFQGTCTYTAAQGCYLEGTRLNPFSVVVENEKWYAMSNNPKVSVAKLVAVEVYGNTLVLRKNQAGMIMVNGIMMSLPVNLNNGAVQAYQEGTYDVITTDFGLRVTYDLVYHIIVTVPGNYRGKTCGLCGNFNDNKNDEFQLPDGKLTKDLLTFGAAWKISVPHVVCEDGCSGDFCPKCEAKKKLIFEADCSIITNPQGPFVACHNVIDPTSYFRDCVYDVCLSEGDRKVLCQSISAYMIDCQDFGVNISNWRTATFCPLDCPANSHYQSCSEICAKPCPGLSDIITCPTTCAEGCACNADNYFNGTGCVKWDLCSCYHKGRTYKIGESVLSEDCQELCTCSASGDVKCETTKCKADESCQVKDGHRGCYLKKCLLETNGAFTLFNGRSGAITAMGAYEIIKVCDNALVEEWFRVVVALQACGKTGLKSVVAVYVYFNDLIVTVNSKHETWINGKKVTLPRLMSNEVSVKVNHKTVMIERMSGLQVSYSLSQEIIVTVSAHMADKVCGACGRLNPSGDIPGPSLNRTMQEYMDGWNAPDFPTCSGGR